MKVNLIKTALYSSLLIFNINTMADEMVSTSNVKLNIEPNNETMLLVDCNYSTKTLFGNKVFNKDDVLNKFMNHLCSKHKEGYTSIVSFKELSSVVDNYTKENDLGSSEFFIGSGKAIYTSYTNFSNDYFKDFQNNKLNLRVNLYSKYARLRDEARPLNFPITDLSTNINVIYNFNNFESKKVEEQISLKYKYDYVKDKIETFELDKPIKILKKYFTNTYDIDSHTECINGQEWVKKYGAKSGRTCESKEIDVTTGANTIKTNEKQK